MTRRGRLIASIVSMSCIAVAACGGADGASSSPTTSPAGVASSTSAAAVSSTSTSAEGEAELDGPIDIGDGRELYVHCTGQGEPTVILESGYHDSSTLWSEDEPDPPAVGPSVQERLSAHVRVCSYDRPGTIVYGSELSLTDRSTPVDQPRLASDAVADLHALIAAAELPTPVVIVGHSMGGLLARLYAKTHPEEVAGVVFVDPFRIEMEEAMGEQWPRYEQLLGTPGTAFDDDPAFEIFDVTASIEEIRSGPALPDVPMLLISKTEPFPLPDSESDLTATLEEAWTSTAQDIVDLGTKVPHVIANGSDHYVQVRQPDLVADAALVVIGRVAS